MFDKAKKLWDLQSKARKLQAELKEMEFTGEELGGKVKVTLSGEQRVIAVEIDDSLVSIEEKDSLIKFLSQAFSSAVKKSQQAAANKTKEVMGGLGIPGL
ncbi:YbaB/EbfC family nucleoid-associated protein [Patescibacteria group bacterium]|nr:YbaB/EbfC family nucleoid-associated protein [Patescibacteria group bacterium]